MGYDDYASFIKSVDFFDVLNEEQIKLLAFASEIRQFNSGEILMEKGEISEGAYILNKGFVVIGDNQRDIYRVGGPAVMIGELALLYKRINHNIITAQGNVLSLFIPRSAFQKLLKQYPDLASKFAKKIEDGLDEYLNIINKISI